MKTPSFYAALLLTLATQVCLAQPSLLVGHSSEFSDNADLTEENTTDQREDRTWLTLGLNFERDNWQLNSEYELTDIRFDSDSETPQPDTEELVGSTFMSVIGLNNRGQLRLSHQRDRLLGAPEELELQSNFQERDTLNISPQWYFQNNGRQQLYLQANYSRVDYSESSGVNSGIDSETTGATLAATRRVSKLNTAGIQIQRQTTEYQDDFSEDNRYDSLVLFLSRDLRRLSYVVSLGYNRSKRGNGEPLDAPQFAAQIEYDNGLTQLNHTTRLFITDTSRGNTSTLEQSDNQTSVNLGNGDTSTISRYQLLSSEVNLIRRLNPRWTLDLALQLSQQDHEEDPTQDIRTAQISARIDHILTPQWLWSLSARREQQNFLDDQTTNDNDQNQISWSLSHQPNERLNARLILNHRVRSSETGLSDFTENSLLAEITYRLRP